MRIGGIGGPAIPRRTTDRRKPTPGTETRALVAIEAPAAADRALSRTRHPAAPFLAQLIATRMQLPQARARRRAEPAEAIAAYGTHDGGGAARTIRQA